MSELPKQPPPRKHLTLPTTVVTQGPFCAPECPNKVGSTCTAKPEPEKLTLNGSFEVYGRTEYCKANAR